MILFLDIDGVLTSARASKGVGEGFWRYFDPVACKYIESACKKYGVKIVISSTWRLGDEHDADYFRDIFYCAGYKFTLHKDFKTKQLPGSRGEEIKEWLGRHGNPEYIILDDDSDMLDEQKPRFIKTDGHDGMLFRHMLKFDKLLLLSGEKSTHNRARELST